MQISNVSMCQPCIPVFEQGYAIIQELCARIWDVLVRCFSYLVDCCSCTEPTIKPLNPSVKVEFEESASFTSDLFDALYTQFVNRVRYFTSVDALNEQMEAELDALRQRVQKIPEDCTGEHPYFAKEIEAIQSKTYNLTTLPTDCIVYIKSPERGGVYRVEKDTEEAACFTSLANPKITCFYEFGELEETLEFYDFTSSEEGVLLNTVSSKSVEVHVLKAFPYLNRESEDTSHEEFILAKVALVLDEQ